MKSAIKSVIAFTGGSLLLLAQDPAFFRTRVVKAMPFSAKAVIESSRALADGNRIVQTSSALLSRDSEGRTRREQPIGGTDFVIVFIQDPVAGKMFVLDTRTKSVQQLLIPTTDAPPNRFYPSAESLGSKQMESFFAEGSRLKQIIPAEKEGNSQPIEIVSENWYSPQLQTMLMRRVVDPRLGQTDYRLTEIQLGEPAASLFTVPDEYKFKAKQ